MGSSSSKLKRKFSPSPAAPAATACEVADQEIASAMALKNLGNEHFKAGEFKDADLLYSQAYAQPITPARTTCSLTPHLGYNKALLTQSFSRTAPSHASNLKIGVVLRTMPGKPSIYMERRILWR